ncbi:hypothetical protein AB0A74_24530 [Saccharothrix sp. NPDC042600]|uniref:hypothetical protein n=1 Tax=Saccharothrix TaxID=2071 RepID=UPI0033EC0C38|nr:hypothetical protein GCM10017745_14990 [Saccharothrix mutabilis subsp. capreolus]
MRPVTALLAALLLATTTTVTAAAAQPAGFPGVSFTLSPLEVKAGGVINATAPAQSCNASEIGPVTSPGFAEPIEWGKFPGGPSAQGQVSGNTRVSNTPGTYTATVKCLNTPDSAEVTFTIVSPRVFGLIPLEVDPGGEITARMPETNDCTGRTITSPGFVAPLELRMEPGNFPELAGKTTVVSTPGTYQAVMTCLGAPYAVDFTVRGTPPQDPPQTQPKQPVKKPKGAPETGGGATA